jgi:secreted trypsin-like serine protease
MRGGLGIRPSGGDAVLVRVIAATTRRAGGSAVALIAFAFALAWAGPADAATGQARVVGGTEAPTGADPWAAALVRHEREGGTDAARQFCGGALVSSRVVLTAAHCVSGRSPAGIQAVLGREDLRAASGERIDVVAMGTYPFHDPRNLRGDAAVLLLAQPSTQPPVALGGSVAQWQSATVLGWGSTQEGGPVAGSLQSAALAVLPDRYCSTRSAYGLAFDRSTMICAGSVNGGVDACQGDSGGPLTTPDGSSLIGLVSWGRGCGAPGKPGVYTRLGNPLISSWVRAATAAYESGHTTGPQPETVVAPRRLRASSPRTGLRVDSPGSSWAAFQCAAGRGRYRVCSSRIKVGSRVRRRTQLLRVRAIGLFGEVDPTPLAVRFRGRHPGTR